MEYQSEAALAELAAFVAVADGGGFTAAARRAGLRKATLVERVARLEARLGASLLSRTTRSVRVTDEGRAYLEHARRALALVREADDVVVAMGSAPRGTLRITVSPALAGLLVEHALARYMLAYPDVAVELDVSIRTVDVAREPFDVAIRVGALADSTSKSRRLAAVSGGYYASPAYLARRGVPARPEDLPQHDAIVIPRGDSAPVWNFHEGRRKKSVVVRPRLLVHGFEVAVRAAVAGLGIVPAPSMCIRNELERRALVQILPAFTPPAFEIHAVYAATVALAPKTRAFIDIVAASMKALR